MKTIILGYADVNGYGPSTVVCAPDTTPAEQGRVLEDAKRKHRFPEGLKHLKMFRLEIVESATFIASDIGEKIDAQEKANAERQQAAEAETKKATAAAGLIAAAQAKVQATARARNEAQGKLHQATTQFNNLDRTPEKLRGKLHAKNAEELQKNIPALQEKVTQAIAAYDAAAAELKALQFGKPVEGTQNIFTPPGEVAAPPTN